MEIERELMEKKVGEDELMENTLIKIKSQLSSSMRV